MMRVIGLRLRLTLSEQMIKELRYADLIAEPRNTAIGDTRPMSITAPVPA